MNKTIIIAMISVIGVIGILGYVLMRRNTLPSGIIKPPDTTKELSAGTNPCDEFPLQWVSSQIGKTITKSEPFDSSGLHVCQYYTTPNAFISIKVEDLNAENLKKGQVTLGRTIGNDPQIPMEHFIATQPDGLINSIYLVLGPDKVVAIDRSSKAILADNVQDIAFAAAVAKRMINGENQISPKKETSVPMKITPDEEEVVESFLKSVADHKPSEAVLMMTSDITGDDSIKQAWAIQLNAFNTLVIKNIEPSMKEGWTETEQTYKVTLDVTMKPEAASAQPMPNYGYDNGVNIRWITIKNSGSEWKVSGIATGP